MVSFDLLYLENIFATLGCQRNASQYTTKKQIVTNFFATNFIGSPFIFFGTAHLFALGIAISAVVYALLTALIPE